MSELVAQIGPLRGARSWLRNRYVVLYSDAIAEAAVFVWADDIETGGVLNPDTGSDVVDAGLLLGLPLIAAVSRRRQRKRIANGDVRTGRGGWSALEFDISHVILETARARRACALTVHTSAETRRFEFSYGLAERAEWALRQIFGERLTVVVDA